MHLFNGDRPIVQWNECLSKQLRCIPCKRTMDPFVTIRPGERAWCIFVFFIHKASKSSWPTTKFSTKIKLKTMQIYMQIAKFCKIFILLCKVFKAAQSWPGWPYLNMWKREMPNMRNCQSPILISELESISDCDRCSAS